MNSQSIPVRISFNSGCQRRDQYHCAIHPAFLVQPSTRPGEHISILSCNYCGCYSLREDLATYSVESERYSSLDCWWYLLRSRGAAATRLWDWPRLEATKRESKCTQIKPSLRCFIGVWWSNQWLGAVRHQAHQGGRRASCQHLGKLLIKKFSGQYSHKPLSCWLDPIRSRHRTPSGNPKHEATPAR